MIHRIGFTFVLVFVLAGCMGSTALNRGYDRSKIKRIGVVRFGESYELGVGDLFAKHLLKRGFSVVERVRLEAILKEQRFGVTGAVTPETAKEIGKLLGVDGLIMGQVTDYQPQRKKVVMTRTYDTYVEPVFEKVKKENEDGSDYWVQVQVTTQTRRTEQEVPVVFTIDAEVGIVAKLVDVETGEIVWIGSASSEGITPILAVESAVSHLVRKLKKEW